MTDFSRRRFLTTTGALGALSAAGLTRSFQSNAHAADSSGYKALVCVFLKGGMDQADTVLPFDQESYNAFSQVRPGLMSAYNAGSANSSRNRENLLPLVPENADDFGGRQFGLPRELGALKSLFDAGNAAIIGNVGPLIEPTTRTSLEGHSAAIPDRLFSHNDQQSTWMSQGAEGSLYGWGGRFSDYASSSASSSAARFSAITTAGTDVFLSGENTRPFSAPSGDNGNIRYIEKRWYLGSGYNSDAARQTLKEHFASQDINPDNLFMKDLVGYNKRAQDTLDIFLPAIANARSIPTAFPASSLGEQLRKVAQIISIQQNLGVGRQVFYVASGDYDTHSSQSQDMPRLHTDLAASISAFYSALSDLGMNQQVTLFTASDFGRTTVDNGDGTDHGWGGHHFVVGGSVNGNRIYGTIPEADLGAETYTNSRGRLIPSVSVDQYAATLGTWFGLSNSELEDVLPNLRNFDQTNLGFI